MHYSASVLKRDVKLQLTNYSASRGGKGPKRNNRGNLGWSLQVVSNVSVR